uniref:hypothetical protein n=1 Tax=Flavobacterium sp. TaxID=239 RepID=UPI0040490B98
LIYGYLAYTQTFKPEWKVKQKFDIIEKRIEKIFKRFLYNYDIDLYIEYHKKIDGTNDVLSPHCHSTIKTKKDISKGLLEYLKSELSSTIGQVNFKRVNTSLDLQKWNEYCKKDELKNDMDYKPFKHSRKWVYDEVGDNEEKILEVNEEIDYLDIII